MTIAMINGSPKLGKSNSEEMLNRFEPFINSEHKITHYNINKKPLNGEQYKELCRMDVLFFAFPLYIDAIPTHLFRMMVEFEDYLKQNKKNDIFVYAIINNGFYEGCQNYVAVEILKNWCKRCGINFGMAICTGAGEMMAFMEKVPAGRGPLKNLGNAMKALADCVQQRNSEESILFSPNLPRFMWRFTGTHFFWNKIAKKNGLNKRDIVAKVK